MTAILSYRVAHRLDVCIGPYAGSLYDRFDPEYVTRCYNTRPTGDDHSGTGHGGPGALHGCPTLRELYELFHTRHYQVNASIWGEDPRPTEWAVWCIASTDRRIHPANHYADQCTIPIPSIIDAFILTNPKGYL